MNINGNKSEKKKLSQAEVNKILLAKVDELTKKLEAYEARRVPTALPIKKESTKGKPRPNVKYKLLGFPSEKFAPQCLRVMRCLAQACPADGFMTEIEVFDALMGPNSTIGPWPYRQTPFYIFKYYRSAMVDADYLRGPLQT